MNIHFQLRSQGKGDPVIILKVFDSRFKGRFCRLSTGLKIPAADWDKRKQRVKNVIPKAKEYNAINTHLDAMEQRVISFHTSKLTEPILQRQDLKKFVNVGIKPAIDNRQNLKQDNQCFYDTWQRIIDTTKNSDGEPIAASTKQAKLQTLRLIERFAAKSKVSLSFQSLDMRFYHEFDGFMRKIGFSGNTRGKHFKNIKAVLREALDRDERVNLAFQKKSFKVIRTEPDTVFLTEFEIRKFFTITCSRSLQELRDTFVAACYSGPRYSDWHHIDEKNIESHNGKEILKIHQLKTKNIIHVPVHPIVKTILTKYNGRLPSLISNQKFNEGLKKICKLAELGSVTIGDVTVPKWQLVSTHTARRSFATNAYLSRSMDVHQIMRCTGHKKEASFLRYLRLNGRDFAIQSADSDFFTQSAYRLVTEL